MFSSKFCKRLFARKRSRVQPIGFRPRLEALEDRALPSTLTVLNNHDSGAGSLRDTIAVAASGDTIKFATSLNHQTIVLNSQLTVGTNLDIEGRGADLLTINGNGHRVFSIPSGVTATIAGLAIVNGSADQGAGIDNAGALSVARDTFTSNIALGDSSSTGQGGAIYNEPGGTLAVDSSSFKNNQATGGAGLGWGGAISNQGTATVTASSFEGNQATGGSNGYGSGGAISTQFGGPLTVSLSSFTGNKSLDGTGFFAAGGAIDEEFATLAVDGCSFTNNQCLATNFTTSFGGGIENFSGTASVKNSTFANNLSEGIVAFGGGLLGQGITGGPSSTNTVSNCLFVGNQAVGIDGGFGASGAIDNEYNAVLTLSDSTLIGNMAQGAPASSSFGPFNFGYGGAMVNGGSPSTATLTNDNFIGNQAIGGAGMAGPSGGPGSVGTGGAIYQEFSSTLTVVNCNVIGNQAIGGAGAAGQGGGLALGGGIADVLGSTMSISNSVVNNNQAIGGAGGAGANAGTAQGGGILVGDPDGLFPGLVADGASLTVTGCTVNANLAQAGGGGLGGNGGDGLGGGLYVNGASSLCLNYSVVAGNHALGGAPGSGGTAGKGKGGGLYLATGATAGGSHDHIAGNHASTSDDDVFGVFNSSC
jgi:hypothetical protein